VLDARHLGAPGAVAGEDAGHRGAGVEPGAVALGEGGDHLDEPGEAALGVEHAVAEVEVAHQVVHARRAARRGAEEHRGVAEHLAQPVVGELRGDEALQ
jgi:hypothetical protein